MNKNLSSLFKLLDLLFARLYLKFFQEKNALIIFNFHILFKNEKEILLNLVDPQLGIIVDYFCQFVEYFVNHGYSFVSPNDVLEGLNPSKRYIMITFDDGYANNRYLLPIINRYNIPIVLFVSTNNIRDNRCFWWDVLYRERIKQGASLSAIRREMVRLKKITNTEIEQYLIRNFGKQAFYPVGDIDRPLSVSELKQFATEKHVNIGNHTLDHAILTNYNMVEVKSQIKGAQDFLCEVTGMYPVIISYPDGYYSKKIMQIAQNTGLKLGVTTELRKNYLPIDCKDNAYLRFGRFDIGGSTMPILLCELYRSDFIFFTHIWNFLHKGYR